MVRTLYCIIITCLKRYWTFALLEILHIIFTIVSYILITHTSGRIRIIRFDSRFSVGTHVYTSIFDLNPNNVYYTTIRIIMCSVRDCINIIRPFVGGKIKKIKRPSLKTYVKSCGIKRRRSDNSCVVKATEIQIDHDRTHHKRYGKIKKKKAVLL